MFSIPRAPWRDLYYSVARVSRVGPADWSVGRRTVGEAIERQGGKANGWRHEGIKPRPRGRRRIKRRAMDSLRMGGVWKVSDFSHRNTYFIVRAVWSNFCHVCWLPRLGTMGAVSCVKLDVLRYHFCSKVLFSNRAWVSRWICELFAK